MFHFHFESDALAMFPLLDFTGRGIEINENVPSVPSTSVSTAR